MKNYKNYHTVNFNLKVMPNRKRVYLTTDIDNEVIYLFTIKNRTYLACRNKRDTYYTMITRKTSLYDSKFKNFMVFKNKYDILKSNIFKPEYLGLYDEKVLFTSGGLIKVIKALKDLYNKLNKGE